MGLTASSASNRCLKWWHARCLSAAAKFNAANNELTGHDAVVTKHDVIAAIITGDDDVTAAIIAGDDDVTARNEHATIGIDEELGLSIQSVLAIAKC